MATRVMPDTSWLEFLPDMRLAIIPHPLAAAVVDQLARRIYRDRKTHGVG